MENFCVSLFASFWTATAMSSASHGQFGRCSRPKGLHNRAAFLPDNGPCFPVCQLLWPLRDALWRRGPWQDEVMAACERSCTPSSAGQTWAHSPVCHPNISDQLTLGIWSNCRNADKAGRLGAKAFECREAFCWPGLA